MISSLPARRFARSRREVELLSFVDGFSRRCFNFSQWKNEKKRKRKTHREKCHFALAPFAVRGWKWLTGGVFVFSLQMPVKLFPVYLPSLFCLLIDRPTLTNELISGIIFVLKVLGAWDSNIWPSLDINNADIHEQIERNFNNAWEFVEKLFCHTQN